MFLNARTSVSLQEVHQTFRIFPGIFEFSEWTIQAPSHDLRIVIIYPPQTDADDVWIPTNMFFSEFCDYLETVFMCKEQLMVEGDFNFHMDTLDNGDAIKMLDIFKSLSPQQHVVSPIHVHGHTLDLAITR